MKAYQINKQKLFEYFGGKLTTLEKQQIEQWCRDPFNTERFYLWLDEFEQSHLQYVADVNQGMIHYHRFLHKDQPTKPKWAFETNTAASRKLSNWIWMSAASVIVVLSFLFQDQLLNQTYTTGYAETCALRLSDGSAVTLNANSSLKIPRFGFGSSTREVHLQGEALFSVRHTLTDQRFLVKTDNRTQITVLGTEFTVFARRRGTRVELNRGKIEVDFKPTEIETKHVTMIPGDVLTIQKGKINYLQKRRLAAKPAWLDHRFEFDQTPLSELAAIFSEQFGIQMTVLEPDLAKLTVSGSFTARTADELLEILSVTANLSYRRTDSSVLLMNRSENH